MFRLLIIILSHTLSICLIDLPWQLWLWALIVDDVALAVWWAYSLSGVYYISRFFLYYSYRLGGEEWGGLLLRGLLFGLVVVKSGGDVGVF